MIPTVTLRQAAAADFDFLYDLHRQALRDYVERTWGWDEDWQRAHFARDFDLAGKRIIQYGGADIGCIAVHDRDEGIFLAYIALLPAFQGLGIGTRLIEELLQRAQDRGLPVTLKVLKANPARALYERLGFEVIDASNTHYFMEARPGALPA